MRICSYVRFVRVFLFSLVFFEPFFSVYLFAQKHLCFFSSFSILGFQFYDLPNIRRLGFIHDDKWKKKRHNKIKETSTIWNIYKKNRNKIFAQSVCAMHATPTPLKYCYYYFQLNEAGFRWNLSAFFHHIQVLFFDRWLFYLPLSLSIQFILTLAQLLRTWLTFGDAKGAEWKQGSAWKHGNSKKYE